MSPGSLAGGFFTTTATLFILYIKSESVSRSVMASSFGTPRTVARQTPLFTGFSRQEYWSG